MPNPEALLWLSTLPPGSVVVIGPDSEPERVLTQAEVDAEYVDGEVVFQTREE